MIKKLYYLNRRCSKQGILFERIFKGVILLRHVMRDEVKEVQYFPQTVPDLPANEVSGQEIAKAFKLFVN